MGNIVDIILLQFFILLGILLLLIMGLNLILNFNKRLLLYLLIIACFVGYLCGYTHNLQEQYYITKEIKSDNKTIQSLDEDINIINDSSLIPADINEALNRVENSTYEKQTFCLNGDYNYYRNEYITLIKSKEEKLFKYNNCLYEEKDLDLEIDEKEAKIEELKKQINILENEQRKFNFFNWWL